MRSTVSGALRRTIKEEMERDNSIFIIGEDIGDPYGGIHNVTKGLMKQFGPERVINSPLSEIAITGAGVGAAISGMRPIVEIMYADFLPIAMDQIVNSAAKMHFLSHGKIKVPMVIRANFGCGKGEGAQHSQCPDPWFMSFPGLKIVAPSSPREAQGLLKSSIEDNNPVLFYEHKLLYNVKGEILSENESIPIGKANILKKGTDITIVAWSLMVYKAMSVSEKLNENGISAEIIDMRTLKPLDMKTICESVKKTGRLLIVEENNYTGGVGAQIVESAINKVFNSLKSVPQRLATPDVPMPALKRFEDMLVPNEEKILKKACEMCEG